MITILILSTIIGLCFISVLYSILLAIIYISDIRKTDVVVWNNKIFKTKQ